jgi:hypothetical protein
MKIILYSMIFFLIISCSKKDDSSSSSSKSSCPDVKAKSSNLTNAIEAEPAMAIHESGASATFFIQLNGSLNTTYEKEIYDVDLFDTSAETIAELKISGKKVICYFSAGSSEDWRSDFNKFNKSDMGKSLDGWDGEKWLDIRSQNVLNIMIKRLDLAVDKGCDGVDPDNMDGYTQDSCFDITSSDQLAYNKKIANLARIRGLSVGLKNDPEQVEELEPFFDFSVNEQCHQYNECEMFLPFVNNNKPVFNLEYKKEYRNNPYRDNLCSDSESLNIRTLIMDDYLQDDFVYFCDQAI